MGHMFLVCIMLHVFFAFVYGFDARLIPEASIGQGWQGEGNDIDSGRG